MPKGGPVCIVIFLVIRWLTALPGILSQSVVWAGVGIGYDLIWANCSMSVMSGLVNQALLQIAQGTVFSSWSNALDSGLRFKCVDCLLMIFCFDTLLDFLLDFICYWSCVLSLLLVNYCESPFPGTAYSVDCWVKQLLCWYAIVLVHINMESYYAN